MKFFCVQSNTSYRIIDVDDFRNRVTNLIPLATSNTEYNSKIFESEFGYRLSSIQVDSKEEQPVYVLDAYKYVLFKVEPKKVDDAIISWHDQQQFFLIPIFMFALMANLSNIYDSSSQYHILVQDF